jgi:hypothetical protein
VTFRRVTVAGEALANLRAHRLLTGLVVAVGLVTPAAALALSLTDVHGIVARQEQLVARGSTVFSITTTDRTTLPAERCDEANRVSGVRAAGGIVDSEPVHVLLPDYRYVQLLSVTPGLPLVYWPDGTAADGTIAGSVIAADFGLVPGATLPVSGPEPRDLAIGVTEAAASRSRDYDLVLAQVVTPTGSTYECLVESLPGAQRRVEAVLTGWFPGVPTLVTPYFAPADSGRSPQEELATRLSAWFPVAAALIVAGAVLASWTIRRPEFALYAILGLGRGGLLLMVLVEWAALALLPGSVGLVAGSLVATGGTVEATVAALDIGRYLVGVAAIPALGLVALTRVSAFDALKGR